MFTDVSMAVCHMCACPCSNSRKYAQIAMQMIYTNEVYYDVFDIENEACNFYSSYTWDTQNNTPYDL